MSIVKASLPDSLTRASSRTEATLAIRVSTTSKLDLGRGLTSEHPPSLLSQGVNGAWFLSGIRESNGALFHASLYPILPALRLRVELFLKTHPEVSAAWGPFAVTHLIEEIIAIAFEHRDRWTSMTTVVDWLAGYLEMASNRLAKSDVS